MGHGNSLAVQWLGPCAFTAGGPGSIPGQATKILQAAWCGQKKQKQKQKSWVQFLNILLNIKEFSRYIS